MSTFMNDDNATIPNEQTLDTLQEWLRRTHRSNYYYVSGNALVVRFDSVLALAQFEHSYSVDKQDPDDWFVKRFYSPNVRIDFPAITSFGEVEAWLYPVER